MRVAAVDLGTNSTRLLVADIAGDEIREVARRSTVTRLGRGVDLTGSLSHEAIHEVCDTVEEYLRIAGEQRAEMVAATATSAVRDAANGEAFIAELRERFALHARVIDGEEEAKLTYFGATADGRPAESTLIVDIGGGSTELVVGKGDDITFFTSLQAGVLRHTERHIKSDPPSAAELEGLATDVREQISSELNGHRTDAKHGIAVAGTPTSLAAIDLQLDPYDPDRVHGHRLELRTIQRMLSRLASLPLAERLKVTGLHPRRAPAIVAGIVILVESMRAFGLQEIEVSEHDILYGAALDAARA